MSMDNPRYQRLQQRLATLRPEQRAILSTAQNELTAKVADADARNELEGRRTAMQQQQADRQHELSRGSLDINRGYLDLKQDEFGTQKQAAKKGELLGLANLGLSGGLGYLDMKNSQEQAQRTREQQERIAAMARRYLNDGGM